MITGPRIIAHRGASLEMPENTLPAYQTAIDIGADFVELDVHLTSDREVVCHHDAAVGSLAIATHRLGELRRVFSDLPTLQDVLQLPFGITGLMIELKGHDISLADAVLKLVAGVVNPTIFLGSFSIALMTYLNRRWPSSQLVAIAKDEQELAAHLALRPHYVAIVVTLATKERMQALRLQGVEVWVWTVDDPAVAESLHRLGAQGIISNDPRRIKGEY